MALIAVGADHAGFLLKEHVKSWLRDRGFQVLDCGTHSTDAVDYPDYAAAVAAVVSEGEGAYGVLVCGTGIGMAIAANKLPGVRAAVCADVQAARLSREHNDANVLALGARVTPPATAFAIVEAWLTTEFLGGRHARRVEKLAVIERSRAGGAEVHAPAR